MLEGKSFVVEGNSKKIGWKKVDEGNPQTSRTMALIVSLTTVTDEALDQLEKNESILAFAAFSRKEKEEPCYRITRND